MSRLPPSRQNGGWDPERTRREPAHSTSCSSKLLLFSQQPLLSSSSSPPSPPPPRDRPRWSRGCWWGASSPSSSPSPPSPSPASPSTPLAPGTVCSTWVGWEQGWVSLPRTCNCPQLSTTLCSGHSCHTGCQCCCCPCCGGA